MRLPPPNNPLRIPILLTRKHKAEIRRIPRPRHPNPNRRSLLRNPIHLLRRLIALMIKRNLLLNRHRDLLNHDLGRLLQMVQVRTQLDIHTDWIERPIRPPRQRYPQRDEVVRHHIRRLGAIVHPKRRQRIVPLYRHRRHELALVRAPLLHRNDQLIPRLRRATRELQTRRWDPAIRLLTSSPKRYEQHEG